MSLNFTKKSISLENSICENIVALQMLALVVLFKMQRIVNLAESEIFCQITNFFNR